MRRLLNTLYVTTANSYLACDGENVLIRIDDEIKFRVPIHNLEGIVCFGFAGASPKLMYLCCERGVALSFFTEYGKFYGRISGKVSGNVLLRRTQYRWADDCNTNLRLAKRFIVAKVFNARAVLQRVLRDHAEVVDSIEELERAIKSLANTITRIENTENIDSLRGIEGEAARIYFANFNSMILKQKNVFIMSGRNRRPPLDPVNGLLSFLYTLLMHEVVAALESVGLDPQVGFLHRDRPGRFGLALDMMEELRIYFADRLAVTLINRQQISAKDFLYKENGAVIMSDEARKEVLMAWQKRKQEEITHPFLGEKISFGLVPYVQSLLLARHMSGDLEDYPPFFWK